MTVPEPTKTVEVNQDEYEVIHGLAYREAQSAMEECLEQDIGTEGYEFAKSQLEFYLDIAKKFAPEGDSRVLDVTVRVTYQEPDTEEDR